MSDPLAAQFELFGIFDQFFRRATGKSPKDFAKLDEFGAAIRANVKAIAPLAEDAFKWGIPELMRFYAEHKTTLWSAAQDQGGMKLVLGGGGRFGKTQLNAVRRLLLYADTVLIPDPILSWIETPREEEKFRHVEVLQAMFFLLRLKPFIDARFGYPPVIVFQSWERSLVQNDAQTREELQNLTSSVLSVSLGVELSNLDDVVRYANENTREFLDTVEKRKLFVAPGGIVGEPLSKAIARYKSEIRQWRTGQHLDVLENLSDAEFVCNGIFERLEPQFHLIENASELRAQPLLPIRAQAHYFSICAASAESRLVENEVITPTTRASVMALADQQFEWLGNAPIPALVEMRQKNENERFRAQLSKSVSLLNSASLADLDRVAPEVSREIGSLLNEHRVEAHRIEETYQPKYAALAATGLLTLGAFAIPHLAPLFAAVPPLLMAKQYVEAKLSERREKRELAGSLLGILADAETAPDNIE